jgi:hypothetical protein
MRKYLNNIQIAALGEFLMNYETELNYIKKFQELMGENPDINFHESENKGSFKSFVNQFGVARNIEKGKTLEIIRILINELKNNELDPNELSKKLQHLTHNSKAVSLSSKILFLYKPEEFIPLDSLNKKTLLVQSNDYVCFSKELNTYISNSDIKKEISKLIKTASPLVKCIEDKSMLKMDFNKIKTNRLIDKYLRVKNK